MEGHAGAGVRGALLLVSLILGQPQAVSFTAVRVDRVEREIQGGRTRLFTTFLTVHQVNGRQVSPRVFWRVVGRGKTIQAKLYRRSGLLWAARINVKE